jgi:hypothetical protein
MTKVAAADRRRAAGPAAVELTMVEQGPLETEQEEIRRAGRPEGRGGGLGLVGEIREREACGQRLALQPSAASASPPVATLGLRASTCSPFSP